MDSRLEVLITNTITKLEKDGISAGKFIELVDKFYENQPSCVIFDFVLSRERIADCIERSECPSCGDKLNIKYNGCEIFLKCTHCNFEVK